MTTGSTLTRAIDVVIDRPSWRTQPSQFRHAFPLVLGRQRGPPPPTRDSLLADFRRCSALGDERYEAVRLVSRWIWAGHEVAELASLVSGLTADVIEEGSRDATERMTRWAS